jgi:glycosyltransferase involved in cell wall biosynthesis
MQTARPTASVILATYRQPEWLRKVLWGYGAQTTRDFEILVADDGSGTETAGVIDDLASELPVPVRHIWHEDRGFRKCLILNRAVLQARAEYLIFSDGDCVPRDDFVATHVRLRRPGRFLSGGALPLPMEVSRALDRETIESGRFARYDWLSRAGYQAGRRRVRLLRSGLISTLLDHVTTTGATWNGNNSSVARSEVLRVNGFESELGSGGQDREFGARLENAGVRGIQIRHRAALLHLDHPRPYRSEESIAICRQTRDEVQRTGRVRALNGIDELVVQREPEHRP